VTPRWQMEHLHSNPHVARKTDDEDGVEVAYLRGPELTYDSKAHEAMAAAFSPISNFPSPASWARLQDWQKTGATRDELRSAGDYRVESWLSGAREDSFTMELCTTDTRALKYRWAMAEAARHVPEVSARLNVTAGRQPDGTKGPHEWPTLPSAAAAAAEALPLRDRARERGLTCAAVPARMLGARVQVGRRGEERCAEIDNCMTVRRYGSQSSNYTTCTPRTQTKSTITIQNSETKPNHQHHT
jgi:hypothetical protein